ncbi:arylsulfatase [Phenylobacterium sp.]|uniref:arylsulfatase n=1 Tax=Phenylobacterium sp. TaxID=1871053 RepID=UPI0027361C85|nr:arylsulfatase [Phenylobacterium sp.]MDP3855763.1 arylsulfatase [Phenylobacterium sp.]
MTTKTPSGEDFQGVIGRTIADSKPWWPASKIKAGSPNVVLVVLDDTGFSHFGCYGSTLATPNIDALAAGGLRFTSFHTTALCSPTRACLLTGRNHHAVGMRAISNFDTGYPNMRGAIPRSAATLAEILRDNGYGAFAAGKWHLAPMSECSAAGPYTNWPLQKGFDRYYGFLQGETDQFFPELTHDNHFIDAPGGPEDGYHVSEDIVDRSAGMIRDLHSLVPEKPFFLYLAFGAMHSPHQAPQSYLDKWRGKFDAGWDVAREEWFARQKELGVIPPDTKLAPHNPGVRPWTDLSVNEQRFAARLQEAFAAMLEHTDDQIGRLVAFLKSIDQFDDTLFIVMSDNGASQEGGASGVLDEMKWFNGIRESVDEAVLRLNDIGGPNSHSNIPWGWAQAGNTPLKWYKQNTHGGGVRDPLIMHWPNQVKAGGETRGQFCHVIDIAPTILDALGIETPTVVAGVPQTPVHGVSLKPTFADASAALDRGPQYFEMLGHRGIWKDGWKAVTHHTPGQPFDEDRWELYHLAEDFSEHDDLAETNPEKLKEMVDLWWAEAQTHGVLPLDDRPAMALFRASMRPGLPASRNRFVYYPPLSHLVSDACPSAARGWTTSLQLEHPAGDGDGALIARGSLNSGFVLFVKQGRLVFDYNEFHHHTRLTAATPLTPGPHDIGLVVTRTADGGGDVVLSVDGQVVASGRVPRLLFIVSSTGMDLGRSLSPVVDDYVAPFAYPGKIAKVVFETPESMPKGEVKAQVRAEMVRQ